LLNSLGPSNDAPVSPRIFERSADVSVVRGDILRYMASCTEDVSLKRKRRQEAEKHYLEAQEAFSVLASSWRPSQGLEKMPWSIDRMAMFINLSVLFHETGRKDEAIMVSARLWRAVSDYLAKVEIGETPSLGHITENYKKKLDDCLATTEDNLSEWYGNAWKTDWKSPEWDPPHDEKFALGGAAPELEEGRAMGGCDALCSVQ